MKLKTWRLRANLTQDEAAEMLGIEQAAVSLYESGKRGVSLARALRIESRTGGMVRAEHLPLTERARDSIRLLRRLTRGSAKAG